MFNGFEVFTLACLPAIGVVAQAVVHQVAAPHYMLIAACTFPAVTAVETMFISEFGRAFSVLVGGCGK